MAWSEQEQGGGGTQTHPLGRVHQGGPRALATEGGSKAEG